jgi:hypothetical protein
LQNAFIVVFAGSFAFVNPGSLLVGGKVAEKTDPDDYQYESGEEGYVCGGLTGAGVLSDPGYRKIRGSTMLISIQPHGGAWFSLS